MDFRLTVKNYRCFADSRPAQLAIGSGFTALVGVNNSGKSSLLRLLYEFRPVFGWIAGHLLECLQGQQGLGSLLSVQDPAEIFCRLTPRDIEMTLELLPAPPEGQNNVPNATRLSVVVSREGFMFAARVQTQNGSLTMQSSELRNNGTFLLHHDTPVAETHHLVELCSSLAQTVYIGPFRNALNLQGGQGYYDLQIGREFIQGWRAFQTGNSVNDREAAVRLMNELGRIFGIRELRIDASHDEQTLQVMIDGRSYKLADLGSGLAQFIIVLANVARRRPSYILIDEPESNLHPSLQMDFLTTLTSYASQGVIYATHSIGLARSSAERIYSLRKLDTGESQVSVLEDTPDYSEFLGELSYSGYRELGFNAVLLVEGPTEVRTVQQMLRAYHKEHQVVLLPLGGRNLISAASRPQLEEITRITRDVHALVDSERTGPDAPVQQRISEFQQTCEELGIRCHVLVHRAIENYFSNDAVQRALGPSYRALGPFEARNEVSPVWGKADNWRVARMMTRAELDATDLGEFLASI